MMKGLKKSQINESKTRLPLTSAIITRILSTLDTGYFSFYVDRLMEVVCVVAFIGFLRCGEFTVLKHFSPELNVCYEDVIVFEDRAVLKLRASKTDPFRQGVNICPVTSILRYLKVRKP